MGTVVIMYETAVLAAHIGYAELVDQFNNPNNTLITPSNGFKPYVIINEQQSNPNSTSKV